MTPIRIDHLYPRDPRPEGACSFALRGPDHGTACARSSPACSGTRSYTSAPVARARQLRQPAIPCRWSPGTMNPWRSIRARAPARPLLQASSSESTRKVDRDERLYISRTPPDGAHAFPRAARMPAPRSTVLAGVNYREAYGMFTCNGILFKTRRARAGRDVRHPRLPAPPPHAGAQDMLYLGNIDASATGDRRRLRRGHVPHAPAGTADDYVIAPAERTAAEFLEETFATRLDGRIRADRSALLPSGGGRLLLGDWQGREKLVGGEGHSKQLCG